MKNWLKLLTIPLSCLACSLLSVEPVELDLDTAVERTLHLAYPLRIAQNEADAKRGLVQQAGLYPNPEIAYEVENFGGTNAWKGWKSREERYTYTQLFETMGKINTRVKAASYQYYAALVGYDVSKLIVLNRLSRTFIQVAAAQELLKVTYEQMRIAQEVLRIATKKIEAGKASLIQQSKAEVAYSTAVIAKDKAEVDFTTAKRKLAVSWASVCPDFDLVAYPFFAISRPIPLEECLADLCNQPEIVQALYNYWSAKENWRLQKKKAVPDVTLTTGYKFAYENNDQGLIAGVSLPLPIFDRNQGNIRQARFEVLKTGNQGKQLWVILEAKLAILYEELTQAYEEAERLRTVSLPSAVQAFDLAQKGYREGKFEYLDVLDAQRTLFDVRVQYLNTLTLYHQKRADIDFLNSQTE